MENRTKIISLLAVTLLLLVANTVAKCGDCLSNNIACINSTSFQLCPGGKKDTSQTFTCPDDGVCTGLKVICAPVDSMAAACDVTLGCGKCGISGFTCVTKTKFALCSGGSMTEVQGQCPHGTICDSSSSTGGVCVDQCGTPSCNIED